MKLRFAPSPTGYLHIGNARTAILNHLIAKKEGATLVLRVEDTDSERSSRESEESIISDLQWLGITWQEGPDRGGENGPYRQSERYDIYRSYTENLLSEGKAYHCYCSQEEIASQREAAEKAGGSFVYPGTCRNLSAEQKEAFEKEGRKPVVRFRVPDGETITFSDLIKGDVTFSSDHIGGDFIIQRSDGSPIYNYIVTIDDTLMGISHVIRGEDHLSNTPKQILIARALGLPEPKYAHLALVVGSDRAKLSKRHGITSVNKYREEGYIADALINYIAMLGWASESGKEIYTRDELVAEIEITSLAKSAAVFDFQKLRWMNGQHLRAMEISGATDLFLPFIEKEGYDVSSRSRDYWESLVAVILPKCEILSDVAPLLPMFLQELPTPDDDTRAMLLSEEGRSITTAAAKIISSGEISEADFSTALIPALKEATGLKGKKLFHSIRALVTMSLQGPELDLALPLIGFDTLKKRIEFAEDLASRG